MRGYNPEVVPLLIRKARKNLEHGFGRRPQSAPVYRVFASLRPPCPY